MKPFFDERSFWQLGTDSAPTRDALTAAGAYLMRSLSSFLEADLSVFHEHVVDTKSVNLSFHTSQPLAGPLGIQLEGVCSLDLRRGEEPSADASILLFSHDQRLTIYVGRNERQVKGSELSCRYVRRGDGYGEWKVLAFAKDETGEWDYVLAPRTELYGQLRRTEG